MSDTVRNSHIFVECHIACDKAGVSEYVYDISFEGNYIPIDRHLTEADLRELRGCIDAALKLSEQKKGGEK